MQELNELCIKERFGTFTLTQQLLVFSIYTVMVLALLPRINVKVV